jgi:hypothetical protein
MSDAHDDLRATAEDIATDGERLQALEEEKATLDAGDPRADEITAEVVRLVERLGPKVVAQKVLTDEAG